MKENDQSRVWKFSFPFLQDPGQLSWAAVAMVSASGIMQQNIGRTRFIQRLAKPCPICAEFGDFSGGSLAIVPSIVHHQKPMRRGIAGPVAMQQPTKGADTADLRRKTGGDDY